MVATNAGSPKLNQRPQCGMKLVKKHYKNHCQHYFANMLGMVKC